MCMLPCVRGDALSEIVYHAVMVYSLWLFGVLCLYVVAYPDRWPLAMFVWYVALVPAVYAL